MVALLVVSSVAAGATLSFKLPRLAERGLLLPADHPVVLMDEQIAATFGMQNPVIWVIAARNGDIWQPALLSRVQGMTREAFAIPGVIGPEIVSLASPNVRDFRSSEDLLAAVYLMASVPQTPAEIDALRRRIERDPLYHGTLVSLDGRAAMVVADFQAEADGAAVAAAARKLRDRYGDERAHVYVTGAPIVGASVADYRWWSVAAILLVLAVGATALTLLAGTRVALAVGGTSALSLLWALAASFAFDCTLLPWVLYGVLPAVLIAPALVIGATSNHRERAVVCLGLMVGFIGMALADDVPAQTFGMAGVLGVLSAFVIGGLVRESFADTTASVSRVARTKPIVLVLVVLIATGMLRSNVSLQLFGHGARYLPARASSELQAVSRHFPPPLTFALRIRGEPGFVTSPEVLRAFESWTNAVRDDPAVVRAMSLADLVEMVHRAFNSDQPGLASMPDDAALVSRYLTLAYSPGFRRFLDRSFSQTAVWTYLSSERPSDVARVDRTLSVAMATHPLRSGEVDRIAGDAAVLLDLWRAIRGMIGRGLLALLVGGMLVGAFAGRRLGLRFVFGGVCAGAFLGGVLGWLGLPFDLVTFPALVSAVVAGAAYATLGSSFPLAAALVAIAIACGSVTLVGGGSIGTVTAAVALAPLISYACMSSSRQRVSRRVEGGADVETLDPGGKPKRGAYLHFGRAARTAGRGGPVGE